MKFGVRVALGALVGLGLAAGLGWSLDAWWVGAVAGGLGGPLVFLLTFFVWSADRLDEGYEQVLFDRPNTLASAFMALAFAGAAFGAGALHPSGPSWTPEEEAAFTQVREHESALETAAAGFQQDQKTLADGGQLALEDLDARVATARELRDAAAAMELPESFAPLREPLAAASDALAASYEALRTCADGDTGACVDARVGFADYARADAALDEKAGELGFGG